MSKVLIVVDVQEDFVTGALGSDQAQKITPNVIEKINNYRSNKNSIIFTRDTHNDDYMNTQEGQYLPVPHCLIGTGGWDIYDGLEDKMDIKIDKSTFGYLGWNDNDCTDSLLMSADEIEICGLCTGICVVSNALILKAMYPETKITVDASCCACVSEESHLAALTVLRCCQVNIINDEQ